MNKLPITDSALFDLIVLIIEDETRTKAHSIEMIRNLLKLTEDNE